MCETTPLGERKVCFRLGALLTALILNCSSLLAVLSTSMPLLRRTAESASSSERTSPSSNKIVAAFVEGSEMSYFFAEGVLVSVAVLFHKTGIIKQRPRKQAATRNHFLGLRNLIIFDLSPPARVGFSGSHSSPSRSDSSSARFILRFKSTLSSIS